MILYITYDGNSNGIIICSSSGEIMVVEEKLKSFEQWLIQAVFNMGIPILGTLI